MKTKVALSDRNVIALEREDANEKEDANDNVDANGANGNVNDPMDARAAADSERAEHAESEESAESAGSATLSVPAEKTEFREPADQATEAGPALPEQAEHPFIQTRRKKNVYSKLVMFTTTRICKVLISLLMAVPPALTFRVSPQLVELYCSQEGWCNWLLRYPHYWCVTMFYVQYLFASLRGPGRAKDIATVETYRVLSDNPELDMYYTPRWCTSCDCWKPPRTHHCSICNKCTLRMDHHCPFMGNCLGLHNVGHFLLMYSYALIALAINLLLCAGAMAPYVLTWIYDLYELYWTLEWIQLISPIRLMFLWWTDIVWGFVLTVIGAHGWGIALLAFSSFMIFTLVLGMAIPYFMLVGLNATVLENQLKNRSEYIVLMEDVVVPIGVSFYRQTIWSNVREVFGKQWFRAFLPVPLKVDPRAGTHPRASTRACTLLLARLEMVKKEGCKKTVNSLEDLGIISGPDAQPEPSASNVTSDADAQPPVSGIVSGPEEQTT